MQCFFLNYIEKNLQNIEASDINAISHLHTQNSRDKSFVSSHEIKIESKIINSNTSCLRVLLSMRGIQNDRSNCWANAVLQAMCATPFPTILEDGVTGQCTSGSKLIQTLGSFFKEMTSASEAEATLPSTSIENI